MWKSFISGMWIITVCCSTGIFWLLVSFGIVLYVHAVNHIRASPLPEVFTPKIEFWKAGSVCSVYNTVQVKIPYTVYPLYINSQAGVSLMLWGALIYVAGMLWLNLIPYIETPLLINIKLFWWITFIPWLNLSMWMMDHNEPTPYQLM